MKRAPKAQRTDSEGRLFASRAELARWSELQLLEKAGAIRGLERQTLFRLVLPNGVPIKIGARICRYTADFTYTDNETGEDVIEDVKSPVTLTAESKLRIAVFEAIFGKKVRFVGKHIGEGKVCQPRSTTKKTKRSRSNSPPSD